MSQFPSWYIHAYFSHSIMLRWLIQILNSTLLTRKKFCSFFSFRCCWPSLLRAATLGASSNPSITKQALSPHGDSSCSQGLFSLIIIFTREVFFFILDYRFWRFFFRDWVHVASTFPHTSQLDCSLPSAIVDHSPTTFFKPCTRFYSSSSLTSLFFFFGFVWSCE